MSWMNKGQKAVEQEKQRQEEEQKNRGPYRFFLKPGESRNVIFLDGDEPDEPISIMEHAINIPGRNFPELLTCPGKENGCPLCIAGNQPRFVAFYTIVDTTPFEKRDGTIEKNVKKVLALKSTQAETLIQKRIAWEGLKGRVVTIRRDNDKRAAASGNEFERFIKNDKPLRYPIDKSKETHQSYEWEEILAPKSISELKRYVEFANYNPWDKKSGGAGPATRSVSNDFSDFEGATNSASSAGSESSLGDQDVPF